MTRTRVRTVRKVKENVAPPRSLVVTRGNRVDVLETSLDASCKQRGNKWHPDCTCERVHLRIDY